MQYPKGVVNGHSNTAVDECIGSCMLVTSYLLQAASVSTRHQTNWLRALLQCLGYEHDARTNPASNERDWAHMWLSALCTAATLFSWILPPFACMHAGWFAICSKEVP